MLNRGRGGRQEEENRDSPAKREGGEGRKRERRRQQDRVRHKRYGDRGDVCERESETEELKQQRDLNRSQNANQIEQFDLTSLKNMGISIKLGLLGEF